MEGDPDDACLSTYHLIMAGTHACNLRCRHCYLPDHDSEVLAEATALSLVDQWSRIVENECGEKNGIFHVKGGEPLVIPYFRGLIQRVLEVGNLHLMLTTNGTLGTPEFFDLLTAYNQAACGEITVIVSLDGATAGSHELLRGRHQYQKTIDFIAALVHRDIRTFLNCVLHTDNIHEAEDYLALAVRLGVKQVNFLPLVPKGFGQSLRLHQVSQAELHQRLDAIYQTAGDDVRDLMVGSLPHILNRARAGVAPAHECTAGYRGLFYITPEGDTFTCPNITRPEFSLGNVYRESLLDMMGRLNALRYEIKPRPGQHGDRYLCTGERLLYETTGDGRNLANLVQLQSRCDEQLNATKSSAPAGSRAYCVSRNF
jgi:radical SAM protein with 4Fe4S-binding SPASM domain